MSIFFVVALNEHVYSPDGRYTTTTTTIYLFIIEFVQEYTKNKNRIKVAMPDQYTEHQQ